MSGVLRYEPSGAELWACVRAAAAGERHGPAGTVAALASLAGAPRLGWVHAPPWPRVAPALRGAEALLRGRRRAVFAGTGGWAFGLRAMREALPAQRAIWVLDTLDPGATLRLLAEVGDPVGAAGVVVSASGRTRETRLLAATLAAAWRRAGAPAPVWLSEPGGGLSLTGARDQVALYGTPLSVPALLAGRLLAGARFEAAYRAFAATTRSVGEWAGETSCRLPPVGTPRVLFRLPTGAGPGLRLWTLQAARQGWGGKSDRLRPWPDVAPGAGPADVLVDVTEIVSALRRPDGPAGALAAAMTASYAVAALVTCVAVRHGLRFATHDAVDRYKRLLPALSGADGPGTAGAPVDGDGPGAGGVPAGGGPGEGRAVTGGDELIAALAGWLAGRPDLTALHLVGYGLGPAAAAQVARLADRLGRPVEIHEGSTWNHHSYHLVWHTRSVGVVVVLAPDRRVGTGVPALDACLVAQRRALRDIAVATHLSLAPRSLLLHWRPGTVPSPVDAGPTRPGDPAAARSEASAGPVGAGEAGGAR